ncbi:hypothetical protein [Methylobacterium oryzihabitans]|uniref:Uncharacterized protein n=1 Tax=Methylobacterium oryzihabitans TaxID=2499852 RepID=A0A437PHU4_9HYPH|nr:hypothetical protein [Methylobacterium oryzihabitans]RVU21815.1 hypothetical protein EOE48_01850 [Methylobacterium oryzihabitans]
MNATARFESPLRPTRIEVLSAGYWASAIWCADLTARAQPRIRSATVHRLVPRQAARTAGARAWA